MPFIIMHSISVFPRLRPPVIWPPRDFVPFHDAGELRVRLALPGFEATLRHGLLTVVLPKVETTRPRAIPARTWRSETPRPVRTLDLGTLTPLKEERPGFWRRVKEWLVGRRRSEPLEPVRR